MSKRWFSGGIISGAKWVGTAAKATKVVQAIARISKIEKAAGTVKEAQRLRKFLQRADAGVDLGRARKRRQGGVRNRSTGLQKRSSGRWIHELKIVVG